VNSQKLSDVVDWPPELDGVLLHLPLMVFGFSRTPSTKRTPAPTRGNISEPFIFLQRTSAIATQLECYRQRLGA
jgi:hypothetical protein